MDLAAIATMRAPDCSCETLKKDWQGRRHAGCWNRYAPGGGRRSSAGASSTICRRVSSLKLIHTTRRVPNKVRPTAHCICSRSEASYNILILHRKVTCLFFDQINNYANFRGASHLHGMPSTDLSTVIVDKYVQWNRPCGQPSVRI